MTWTLLALLAAVAARAAAPVDIRTSLEAPLPVPAAPAVLTAPGALAPVGAVSLAAPAFSLSAPAAAAPSLAVPAAPAAALPAAAVPSGPLAVAAALPSASPALLARSAAATGKDQDARPSGAESAKAAGDSFFDGAGARPDAGPEDAQTDKEVADDARLAQLFSAARPGSDAVATLDTVGGFFPAAADLVSKYTFIREGLIEGARHAMRDGQGRKIVRAIEDLASVADARTDPAARRFMIALGRRIAYEEHRRERGASLLQAFFRRGPARTERRHMPRNALGGGDYWDIAAGMNAAGFIRRELEPGTDYTFFDYSPFVVSYLNTTAQLRGSSARAVEADVMTLQKPARPLAVLRTKNAVAYVPDFERKLEQMADWVAPGGRLVIQNDPMAGQRELIRTKHGALALRLLEEGWDLSFDFVSSPQSEHALDSLIFTRPAGTPVHRSPAAARALWEQYTGAAYYANARDW